VLQVGDRYHVYELDGPNYSTVRARGTQLKDFSTLSIVTDRDSATYPRPGSDTLHTSIAKYDVPAMLGSADNADQLVGKRVAVGTANQVTRVGRVEKIFDDQTEAEQWAFEEEGQHLLVAVGGKTISYGITGGNALQQDPATLLGPDSAVRLIGGDSTFGVDDRLQRAIPKFDVGSWKASQAKDLVGLRVAETKGHIVRVGDLVDTFDSVDDAQKSLFDRGDGERLLASFGGKTFVYSLAGGSAVQGDGETLLGPDNAVRLQSLDRTYGVDSRGASRVPTIDLGDVTTGNADSLVGQRVGMSGSRIIHIASLRETTTGSADQAYQRAYDIFGEQLVLRLANGYGIYEVEGGALVGSSAVSRLTSLDDIAVQRDKKMYVAGAAHGWNFWRRAIPFDPSEPIGHELSSYGAARRYLGSFGSEASAIEYIVDNASYNTHLGVVEGTGGQHHVYEISGNGPSWDQQLGDVEGSTRKNYSERTEYQEYRPSPENWSSAYVDEVKYARSWVDLLTDGGTSTRNDTGWAQKSSSRDSGRTAALQQALHQEWDRILEERRRAAEEAERQRQEAERRAAEEAERQRQEQANNSGSTGGYTGGNSSGDSGGYTGGSSSSGGYDGGYSGGYDSGGYSGGNTGGYDSGGYSGGNTGGYDSGGYSGGDTGGYDSGGYSGGNTSSDSSSGGYSGGNTAPDW
jgi:hypothetical protein